MRKKSLNPPSVLIVGAGAMGVAIGYHLHLAGCRVTYLVRPGRVEAHASPQVLYCYDDMELKHFLEFNVTDRADSDFGQIQYVILTLNGADMLAEEGVETLRSLGRSLSRNDAILIVGGVGFQLREHVLRCTGLPEPRVLIGTLAMLCHQQTADIQMHESADTAMLMRAKFAYRHANGTTGFLLAKSNPIAAKNFSRLYARSGISHCRLLAPRLFDAMIYSAFPFFISSELAGWPPVETLVGDQALWTLSCRAQSEIAALPGNGWAGWLAARLMKPARRASMQLRAQQGAKPLSYQAFNRFHHGGKVLEQNVQILRDCLQWGRSRGRAMAALAELLDRSSRHRGMAV